MRLYCRLKNFPYLEDVIAQLEKNVIELEAKFHEEMQRNKMAIATQSDTLLVHVLKCSAVLSRERLIYFSNLLLSCN